MRIGRLAARLARPAAIAVALAFGVVATAPRAARADDTADEADLQFTLGAERYQAGDYRAALQHFLASNRLAPNRNVLFNIARCYEALHQYPDAYRYYARALQGETDAQAKRRIEEALARMAPNVAILKVQTDPPGATLYLDRKDLGQRGASPETFGLATGRYTVIAEAPGYEDATSPPIDVRVGSSATVSLVLKRIVGTVRVEGEAAGAQVRVDAEDAPVACVIPCQLELPPGRHTFYVAREGFKPSQLLVDVAAQRTMTVHPSIEARTGALLVSADEPNAIVEVDGVTRGPAPALLTLPVGTHDVRVSLKGFRAIERKVTIAANEQTRLEDLSLVPLEEVEAASRATEAVEDAPASVTIVPTMELRGMAYPTAWQALRGVRGVYLSDDRGYVTAGFRGFSRPGDYGNRVLVLLDGQPMNDDWVWSSYLGYDLRTDIEDVDRIEVVRGPGSVLYGTGAFSGVVNLVTRSREAPPGYEVGLSTADDGVARARARGAWRFGEDAGLWTSLAAGHGEGRDFFFPEYANDSPPAIAGNARHLDSFDVATWTGRAWWKSITAQWSLNSYRKHLPTGQFGTVFGDERTRQTDTRGMFELRAEPKIGAALQSLSRAHVNYYGYRGTFADPPEQGGTSRETFDGLWAGVEQRLVWTPSRWLRLTGGGEIQQHFRADQYASNELASPGSPATFLDDHHPFQIGAGYVVGDVTPLARLKISAGARLDWYSTFGSSFNPRVAVIVRPYDGGNVKVLLGKAFRAPSTYELYYQQPATQLANEALRPEQIWSAEIEYSHRFSPTVVGVVSAYANVITDLITQQRVAGTPDAPIVQYLNTGAPVVTLGGEAELRKEWKEGWMLSGSYSYQRSRYVRDAALSSIVTLDRDPALREVPNAPEHLAALKGGAPVLGRALLATTRVAFTGPRWDRNDREAPGAPAQQRTEPAVVWDLVLTGAEPKWHVRYALGLYNLFDWRYAVPVSPEFRQDTIVQNGRTLLASGYLDF